MAGSAARDIEAGRAFIRIGADDTPLQRKLKTAANGVIGFGLRVQSIGASVAGAAGGLTAAIVGPVEAFARTARDMHQLSIETGLTTENLSRLQFAAEATGASAESLNGALVHLNRLMMEGSVADPRALDVFRQLRLSWAELQHQSPEQRFNAVADAISRYGNVQTRARIAQEAFGGGAAALVPLLSRGAGGIRQLTDEADRMGFVLSSEAAAGSRELLRDLAALANGIKVATLEIVGGLVPGVREAYANDRALGQSIAQTGRAVGRFLSENKQLVKWVFTAGLGAIVLRAAIKGIGTVLPIVVKGLMSLSAAGAVFSFIASPIGLFVAGLIAAGAAVVLVLDKMGLLDGVIRDTAGVFRRAWAGAGDDFTIAWEGIKDAIMSGDLAGAMAVAGAMLRVVWRRTVATVVPLWRDAMAGLDVVTENSANWLADVFTMALGGWRFIWSETVAFMSASWARMLLMFRIGWATTVNALAALWQPIANLFGADDQTNYTDQLGGQIVEIAQETNRSLAQIETERNQARDRIVQETEAQRAQLRDMHDRRTLQIGNSRRPSADADVNSEVDAARANLRDTTEGVDARRRAREALRRAQRTEGEGGAFGLPAGLERSRGTFSGAALSGLTTGSNPVVSAIEENAREASGQRAETLEAIIEIRSRLDRAGLVG